MSRETDLLRAELDYFAAENMSLKAEVAALQSELKALQAELDDKIQAVVLRLWNERLQAQSLQAGGAEDLQVDNADADKS